MKLLKTQGFSFRSGIAMILGVLASMIAAIVLQKMVQRLSSAVDRQA
jgi:membrane-associated phospholipid phosphatase